MKPAAGLRTGMTVVHHDTGLMDKLMGWGEWLGLPQEDLAATHIEGFMNESTIAKMNPKVSSVYPATDAPWPTCSVLAFKPLTLPGGALVDVHQDPAFAANLEVECQAHLGEPYDWSEIAEFTEEGFLARFDPKAADTEESKAYKLNAAAGHFGVCSEWWEARLEATILKTYGMTVDIFAGTKIGDDHARPSDWLASPMLFQIAPKG